MINCTKLLPPRILFCATALLFWNLNLTHCATSETSDPSDVSKKLAQTLNSSFFSITIQDYFIASRWNNPGTANVVEFRSLTPFEIWGQKNVLRLNLPFRTQSELGPGLSDVRVFDLLIFEAKKGFWGIGPAFNFGINRGPGFDTILVGPAAGFVISSIKKLSFGLLNQNFFNSQRAFTTLQPILAYQPNASWTISLGELPLVFDWNTGHFAVFSVGFQVGYMIRLADQPVRFFVNPQYNLKSNTELYQWTIASGVTIPLHPLSSKSTD